MKDVVGFEGLYAVTSCGRVWSYRKNIFLSPFKNNVGYLVVNLKKDGKSYKKLVHRVVSEAYIENPYNLPQVNHKDENKENNCLTNLEWCTAKYNMNYGTCVDRIVEKNSMPIRCIETGEVFKSLRDCERKTGLSESNISKVLSGKAKQTCGFTFEFI
jgi:hypothetical protein